MSAIHTAGATGQTTIAEAATARGEFSTLASVVRAAELLDTLASPGPFTVFAPTDAAFSKLPEGVVDRLLRPENRVRLASLVTTHILAGQLTTAEMRERVTANHGHLTLRTVDGHNIAIEQRGNGFVVVDERGMSAAVISTDQLQSNGVIHVTDSVLTAPMC